jgi:hypothetical protein
MSGVNVKLSDDDRRAIDLLLDRSPAATAGRDGRPLHSVQGMSAATYLPHASPISSDSLQAVQDVMGLLSLMPDEDPPAGLVQRTLDLIDRSVDSADAMRYRHPALRADPSIRPA